MPPNTCLYEIETKEWASNTLNTILTKVSPLVIESPNTPSHSEVRSPHKSTQNKNYLRKSLSFLESNSFSLHSKTGTKERVRNSRRSQSTILPNTYHQPPCTFENQIELPQLSLSGRMRYAWYMDHSSSKKPLDIFHIKKSGCHNKVSNKEQRGVLIWKDTFKEYCISPPWSKDLKTKCYSKNSIQLAKFIINELLTTEETYLSHLRTIKNFYMDPLIASATTDNKKTSLVNLKNIEIIFAFIPELIILSSALCKHLRTTISNPVEDGAKRNDVFIGKTFCSFESYFEIYIAYAFNFSRSKKYLTKVGSNITYRQLIEEIVVKKDSNRLLLSDYMIAPVQRITRYCLLLTDLLRYTSKTHPDYVYLDRALKSLSSLAYAMNEIQ